MTKTIPGSIFPRGPVWFIKLPHPSLDKPKRASSGVRISDAELKIIGDKRRWAKMPSHAEAVKVRDAWIAELDAAAKGQPQVSIETVTLEQAAKRFFQSKVLQSRAVRGAVARGEAAEKTSTVRNYLAEVERLYSGLGAGTALGDITTPMIHAWRDKLLVSGRRVNIKGSTGGKRVELDDQGIAASSINTYLRRLSAILHREHDEYHTIAALPKIVMLDDEADDEEGEVVALADDEADRLLAASPVYLQRVIQFSLNTGARKTEMMKLTWDKIDHLAPGANARAVVHFVKFTKRNKKRSVTLPEGLRAMLWQMKLEQDEGGYQGDRVFAFKHKYTTSWIEPAGMQEAVDKARAAAELPAFTLHVCRHTFACRVLQSGKPLSLVQQLLGHNDIKTTMIYAKWSKENIADAASVLDGYWATAGAAPAHASV